MPRHSKTGIAFRAALLLALAVPTRLPAQDRLAPLGVSPGMTTPSGGTTYLPYGPLGGGFVPYTPGPGGGLGVMTRSRSAAVGVGSTAEMSTMRTRALPALSLRGRAALAPLTPLRRLGLGTGGMRGPAMSGPGRRPPVGNYPFRLPTSPGSGDAAPAPAMAM